MDQFSLPQALYDIVDFHKGLVLVTGPTGSGKSTTLAAIVNEINKTRNANIITVEDPVEFIHTDNKSIISHREVGKQTETFAAALKAALRDERSGNNKFSFDCCRNRAFSIWYVAY
jgi:twitching motility protein PilT